MGAQVCLVFTHLCHISLDVVPQSRWEVIHDRHQEETVELELRTLMASEANRQKP